MTIQRVMHIGNPGNIPYLFARDRKGSHVILKSPFWDHFGHSPDNATIRFTGPQFANRVLELAKNYDLVHIHGIDWMIPRIREQYPDMPIIMHYHGSDIRSHENRDWMAEWLQQVVVVLLATPDLLHYLPEDVKPFSQYLPNPINEDLFSQEHNFPRDKQTPVWMFEYSGQEILIKEIKEKFPTCHIWNRHENPREYWEMAAFWSAFSLKISWKPNIRGKGVDYEKVKPQKVLSLTDLEFLYLGREIYYWPTGETIRKFPDEHRLRNVLTGLENIYAKI